MGIDDTVVGGVLDVEDKKGVVGPAISNTEIGSDVPLGIGLGVLDAIPDDVSMALSGVVSDAMYDAACGTLVEAMAEGDEPVQVTGCVGGDEKMFIIQRPPRYQ